MVDILLLLLLLTNGIIEDDAGPLAGCELCLADVGYLSWLGASNPDPVTDDKAVSILGQYYAMIWNVTACHNTMS